MVAIIWVVLSRIIINTALTLWTASSVKYTNQKQRLLTNFTCKKLTVHTSCYCVLDLLCLQALIQIKLKLNNQISPTIFWDNFIRNFPLKLCFNVCKSVCLLFILLFDLMLRSFQRQLQWSEIKYSAHFL